MGPTHKELKKKKKKPIEEEGRTEAKNGREVFLVFFYSLRFFSDSRKSVRQNSSG